jgi:hypothetical protein
LGPARVQKDPEGAKRIIEILGGMPLAVEIARRIGDVRGEGNALGNMGSAYANLGTKNRTRECFEAAKTIFRRLGLDDMVQKVNRMMKQRTLIRALRLEAEQWDTPYSP